jgi:hypothetical protein
MATPPISRSTNGKIEGRPGTRRPRSSTPATSSPKRSRRGVKRWGVGAGGATSMGPRSREIGDPEPAQPDEKAAATVEKKPPTADTLLPTGLSGVAAVAALRHRRAPRGCSRGDVASIRGLTTPPHHPGGAPRRCHPSDRAALPAACSGDGEAGEGRGVKAARRRLGFPPGPPTWGRHGGGAP